MNEEQRQMVIETLRRGEDLPAEWAPLLFPPQKREYEMTYVGKEREEEIIAGTLAVPLQPARTFGKVTDEDAWRNMIIFGDNLQAMKTLLEMKQAGKLLNGDGTPGVRLVYIDPPFATRQEFRGTQDQKAYQDKIAGAQFIEFLRKRFIILRELLADNGSIYVHLDWKKGHYAKVILDEVFGEGKFKAEIVWKRADSHNDSTNFGTVHDSVYLYLKSGDFLFNSQRVPISDKTADSWYRHVEPETGRRYNLGNLVSPHPRPNLTYEFLGVAPPSNGWRYSRERMEEFHRLGLLVVSGKTRRTLKIKQYLDESKGKLVTDWWDDISQIRGYSTSQETSLYPTQKPEALLERIVLSSSNPGDIVLDAFAGSGTTCAVAEKLGRRWVAIDCGKLAVYTIQKRMLSLKEGIGQKGKPLTPKPFTLYNAGLYDFSTLRQLPWQDWRFFALQLFGCRDEPHSIGGLKLDGKRQGASVLVFDHLSQPGRRIDEETIETIHAAVGDKVGSRFFIIAPRGVFDFQQDYIDLDDVRYFALRIPYSFINELHHREFTALKQPSDETDVNAIVDAVGFDFIRPPQVTWAAGLAEIPIKASSATPAQQAYVQVEGFESRAYIRGQDTHGGLETLSLVLVDLDYDGDIFVADQVHFAAELKSNEWRIWLASDRVGAQNMVVFIDIFGNEAREIVRAEHFGLPTPTPATAAAAGA